MDQILRPRWNILSWVQSLLAGQFLYSHDAQTPWVIMDVSYLMADKPLHIWELGCLDFEKHHKDQAMNHLYSLVLSCVLLVGSMSVATAQDLQKGYAAYQTGDYATAIQEWTPLANAGVSGVQSMLGFMYSTGQGVPQDAAEAVKWYRLAADQGVANAQYNLGVMCDTGQGIPQDSAEAVKWYRLAADQGHAKAQHNLGLMYRRGRGVPIDFVEAAKLYRLAAKQGDVESQRNLGVMYEYGQGVLQDNVMAHMWYNIASANGASKAGEYRDERAGLMTSAAIEKAQAMAHECMSSGYKNCGG
jgi:TPR repeat protein